MAKPQPEPPGGERPRRRKRVVLLWAMLALVSVLALAVGATAYAVLGRTLSAPDWLRLRIEERLDQAAPGLDVRFGDMQLHVTSDMLARVVLLDVDIRSDTGAQVAQLSDVEAGLAMTGLMGGDYEMRTARLSGAVVTVRRDLDGRIGLALGDVFAEDTPAPDLPTIIARLDTALTDRRLSALDVIEADALTIRYEDARARRGWTADGGRLRLTREDGALRLAGDVALIGRGDSAATLALNAESPIGETGISFGFNLAGLDARDIATQSPALAWADALRAPVSGALRGEIGGDGALGALSATLQIGTGVLQPNPQTRAIPFRGARTYFSYDPAAATLRFDEISVDSDIGTIVSDGTAVLRGLEEGWPEAMLGQFRASNLHADPEGFFDSPLELAGAEIDWRLHFAPFRFELGRFRSTDPALPLRLSGALAAEPDGWRLSVDGRLGEISAEQVLAWWPEQAIPKTRRWIVDNVRSARVETGTLALRVEPGGRPEPFVDLTLDDVALRYSKTLPELTDGRGQLTFYENRLAVAVQKGQVSPPEGGALDVAGSRFTIADTMLRPPVGEVNFEGDGTLTALLSYLDSPKLEIMQKVGKPVDLGEGQVRASGLVVLPLQPGIQRDQIIFQASGIATGLRSDQIVPGKVLSADRLALSVTDEALTVAGKADLSGIPFEGSWTQPLQPGSASRVSGTVTLSEAVAKAAGVGLPDGTFSGRGSGRVTVDLGGGRAPRFSLKSNLAGVGVSLPQIGWRLSRGGTAQLEVAGTLGSPVSIDTLKLNGGGLSASGSVSLRAGGGFDRLRLPTLKVGNWLNSSATLTGRGRNAAPAVALSGGRLDMRSAPFGGSVGGGSGGGGPVTVNVDRLQVTDSIYLTGFNGTFTTSGGLSGDFKGRVGGEAAVTGKVIPQNGGSAFRITSRDAGDVLKGAGIFKTVQDGTFDLTLTPVRGRTGQYDGVLKIGGARLQKAPAIASLLDAISVVGLLDQLNGPGIFFSEVDAKFRLTPQQVILTQSSAVGPSMGISMDGYYDLGSSSMDMQGVVSPVYILNGIGRLIAPRKGEGLIGFNFNLKGPVENPRTLVNPLSIFTPGMFREIFRRPPPKVSDGG